MNTAKDKSDYIESTHRRNWSNLIGKQFHRWTVMEVLPELSPNGSVLCRVQCSCEKHTVKTVLLSNLRSGVSRSCGCLRNEETSARVGSDLLGKQFHYLIVKEKLEERRKCDSSIMWDCECVLCGKHRAVASVELKNGTAIACNDCQRKIGIEKQRESMTIFKDPFEKRIAGIFRAMKQRCYNPNDRDFLRYGARGIYIYQAWLDNPREFVDWSLANGYAQDLSIDRIDVDGPYAPWNCRWVDAYVQANNRKCNIVIESNGMRLTASECSAITGKCYSFFARRPDFGKEYMDEYFKRRNPILPNALDQIRYRHKLEKFLESNPFLVK